MGVLNIFRVKYEWVEEDHDEMLVAKDVTKEEFEKDILEAKDFAESLKGKEIKQGDYLGKGYSVECLPEFFDQIIWFLIEKKGYFECRFDETEDYYADDDFNNKISITKRIQRVEWKDINGEKNAKGKK